MSLLLIVGVVIFLLYQWLVPGSMFRYWLCRRGSIPNHEIFFVYVYKSNGRVSETVVFITIIKSDINL